MTLEIGRFFAAFLVTANHDISSCGFGVPAFNGFNVPTIPAVLFFFSLSGFVMMTAHGNDFGKIRRIPRYFWKRICRIYPVYWLSLIPVLLLNQKLLEPVIPWAFLSKSFTLMPLQTYIRELNPPAWTLRFEVAFYFMFGISLLPFVGRLFLVSWIIFTFWTWFPLSACLPLTYLFGFAWFGYLPKSLLWHFFGDLDFYFFAGLAAGFIFLKWRVRPLISWVILSIATLGLAAEIYLTQGSQKFPAINYAFVVAVVFSAMILSLATLERDGVLKPHRKLSLLGSMSYPLYLLHPTAMQIVSLSIGIHPLLLHPSFLDNLGAALRVVAMIVLSLIMAAIATFTFDIPLQRFLRIPRSHLEHDAL